jgi:phytoene/squalene synthetase
MRVDAARRTRLYDRVAEESARVFIRRYSTSFGLASRLLEPRIRRHVENIYALVRLADEIVDGEAAAAGLTVAEAGRALDDLERETRFATDRGYSSNLIAHAFGMTARETEFDPALVVAFFDSMRTDLTVTRHDQESFERYVYGSAEAVGLMCLSAFLQGTEHTDAELAELETGARALGAAFQRANFLRDIASDYRELGRSYFPGVNVESFSETDKISQVDDIDVELSVAAKVIPRLPAGSRRAVSLAWSLFADLAARLRATPVDVLVQKRVRVPGPMKARIAASAALGKTPPA